MTEKQRQIAELLAEGHGTIEVARRVGVSQGRVSQVRAELELNWAAFQGEEEAGRRPIAGAVG